MNGQRIERKYEGDSWSQARAPVTNRPVWEQVNVAASRQMVVGIILSLALVAFEIFNFDTTQFALTNLLGEVRFLGVSWATILALAFCAIDFAGLAHLFSPPSGNPAARRATAAGTAVHDGRQTQPTPTGGETWYLIAAWLLGATMNAIMTWWAVSLTLLTHPVGNELVARATLLEIVPVFVAMLIWLTRILFIGAFSLAGGQLFGLANEAAEQVWREQSQPQVAARYGPRAPLPETAPPEYRSEPGRRPVPPPPGRRPVPTTTTRQRQKSIIPRRRPVPVTAPVGRSRPASVVREELSYHDEAGWQENAFVVPPVGGQQRHPAQAAPAAISLRARRRR